MAEQIEAARKTQLAKGEVGIKDRKPVLTPARLKKSAVITFGGTIFAWNRPEGGAEFEVRLPRLTET